MKYNAAIRKHTVGDIPNSTAWLERLAPVIVVVLTVLVVVQVAVKRRAACKWSLQYSKNQIGWAIFIIVVSLLVNGAFAPSNAISIGGIITTILMYIGVFRLTRAICRKNDLMRSGGIPDRPA